MDKIMQKACTKNKISKVSKKIMRQCNVCGKYIKLTVFFDGNYSTGHYFGKIEVGDQYIPTNQKITIGKVKHLVYKLIGNVRKLEYWECDKCYNN